MHIDFTASTETKNKAVAFKYVYIYSTAQMQLYTCKVNIRVYVSEYLRE